MNEGSQTIEPQIIVIGGGFGGMSVVASLERTPVQLTLVDRRNHHLFQPLLYEVATAALSPGQIAVPLRHIFRRQKNATVVLGDVTSVDLERRVVEIDGEPMSYDYLVLATGSTHHYFGHDAWAAHAPGLKSVDDALEIRRRFLLTFERADRSDNPDERRCLMTTVIVGGGPTGIELAGTMSEVAKRVLQGEFRNLDPSSIEIVLAEGADRLLPALASELSALAKRDLEKLGVTVRLQTYVTEIDERGVVLQSGECITASNVIWAAGVCGAPIEGGLQAFMRDDRRLNVEPDLSLAGHREVFAVGDLAYVETDGKPVPGLAPAALQMGKYVGKLIANQVGQGASASEPKPFEYWDKGTLATIGRGKAVADIGRFKFGGLLAWLLWVFIHIFFLVGFRNRVMVLIEWAYAYVTFHRGARLITGQGIRPKTLSANAISPPPPPSAESESVSTSS
ncbi:MAG: NAD(P)/FAD-dependent oxidoreductase [Myxococcales bacterium]|nr:NAD(P)/FAD-dependent oxidoreductase [Myxococcales bacterium]